MPPAQGPVPRLISAAITSPLPVRLPDQVFLASYTPEGGRLAPIFEPHLDPATTVDFVKLFGSTDAPYTVLRVARRHGTCAGGANAGQRCESLGDCPGGTCPTSCVGAPATACTTDAACGANGPCGALYDFDPRPPDDQSSRRAVAGVPSTAAPCTALNGPVASSPAPPR